MQAATWTSHRLGAHAPWSSSAQLPGTWPSLEVCRSRLAGRGSVFPLFAFLSFHLGQRWQVRARRAVSSDSARCSLLIDGDSVALGLMTNAIGMLQSEGLKVEAELFAPPENSSNKKWARFIKEYDVNFWPVTRRGGERDCNDDAIIARARKLARSSRVSCIALLVYDSDFVGIVEELNALGNRVVVLVPGNFLSCLSAFRATSAKVMQLAKGPFTGIRVRAILHKDGQGEVGLDDWENPMTDDDGVRMIWNALSKAGYEREEGSLIPCVAKYWLSHGYGPLTVFPYGFALTAIVARIQPDSASRQSKGQMAFVLPLGSGSATKTSIERYGGRLAARVFAGGGPFVLQDSPGMVMQVLSKLGYLDNDLNPDLHDSLLAFCNKTDNKRHLRKLSLLPESGEGPAGVLDKLRQAFLSDQCQGTWNLPAGDRVVRQVLRKEGILRNEEASKLEVLEAMKEHFWKNGWPAKKNYVAYVQQFLARVNCDAPDHRDTLDF
ncbi:unnamed protein product [Effrenium voratum]|uniref:NYN domain-containing protein n=1 Tax=Effrenium voratum TaxID=2562239 RepID=A0AA36IV40_9DINO|nr:unnamed protein product [Effrenium voratum]